MGKTLKKIANGIKNLDIYGEQLNLNVKGRKPVINSICGSIVTICILSTLAIYAYLKYNTMREYADTFVQIAEYEKYFNDTVIVSDRLNFNVAFGMTEFDGKSDFLEDEDYGTMRAVYRAWGVANPEGFSEIEVPSRMCTHEDFNLDENWDVIDRSNKSRLTEEEQDPNAPPIFFPIDYE